MTELDGASRHLADEDRKTEQSPTALRPRLPRRSISNDGAANEAHVERQILGLTSGYYETWRRSLNLLGVQVVSFVLVVVASQLPALDNPQAKAEFYEQVDPLIYLSNMVAQATTFAITATSLLAERDASKVQLTLLMCYITAVAGVVDLLGWLGLGPVACDGMGRPLFVLHYINWLHTTPVMIYLVSLISSKEIRDVYLHMGMDVLMNLLGLVGSLSPRPMAYIFIVASCFLYARVIAFMMSCFSETARHTTNSTDRRSIRIVQYFTLAMWSAFPIIWFAAEVGAVSGAVEEILWVYASLCAKVVFTTSLLTSNFVTLQQRQAKEEAAKENKRRNELVKSLQGSLQHRDNLMSLMSHELKTPLNGIIGLSQGMLMDSEGGFDDEEVRTFIGTVQTRSEHLMNLIVDFLDSASLKKGNLSIAYKECNIVDIINETVMLATPLLSPGVDIRTNIKGRLPLVQADPTRITQVISNLLGNAAKFSEEGWITVTASLIDKVDDDPVRREAAGPGSDPEALLLSFVRIEVADRGPGIPAEEFEKIFMPLYQVDMSSGRKHDGAGLGLSLVKELVEAHGGSVSVSSEVGQGSAFEVILPVIPPRGAAAAAQPADPEAPAPRPTAVRTRSGQRFSDAHSGTPKGGGRASGGSPLVRTTSSKGMSQSPSLRRRGPSGPRPKLTRQNTIHKDLEALSEAWIRATKQKKTFSEETGKVCILSVDDDSVNQMVMQKILKSAGYNVDIAMDGTKALAKIHGSELLHDLILLDVMMPGLTGYEVCEKIRASEDDLSTLPVVMVSAKSKPEDIVTGFNAGSNDYITKPINSKDLLTRVENQLRVVEAWRSKMAGNVLANSAKKLPDPVIARIGKGEGEIADEYKEVTCIRAELVNYKEVVSLLNRQGLIGVLCDVKETFEEISDFLGIYYVPGSDLLTAVTGHERAGAGTQSDRVLDLATQFLEAVEEISEARDCPLEIRIGVHTGPAYAGVVDGKMPQYQFWGDAVEGASRLEETCPHTCIHISQATQGLLDKQKSPFADKVCEYSVVRLSASEGRVGTYLVKAGEWRQASANPPAQLGTETTAVAPAEVAKLEHDAAEAKEALRRATRETSAAVERERQALMERDRVQAREEGMREERDRLRDAVTEKDAALLAAAAKAAEALSDAEKRLEEARAAATLAARDEATVLHHSKEESLSRENQDLRTRVGSAEAGLHAARDELREALLARERASREAAQAHGDLRAEIAGLAAREDACKERLEELQAKVKEVEAARTELTLEVGTLKGALSSAEKMLQGFQDREAAAAAWGRSLPQNSSLEGLPTHATSSSSRGFAKGPSFESDPGVGGAAEGEAAAAVLTRRLSLHEEGGGEVRRRGASFIGSDHEGDGDDPGLVPAGSWPRTPAGPREFIEPPPPPPPPAHKVYGNGNGGLHPPPGARPRATPPAYPPPPYYGDPGHPPPPGPPVGYAYGYGGGWGYEGGGEWGAHGPGRGPAPGGGGPSPYRSPGYRGSPYGAGGYGGGNS